MNMTMRTLAAIWLVAGAQAAAAAEAEPPPVGSDTRAWLDLQHSGAAAAPLQPQPGEVAERVYERYLESFERKVPEQFSREAFVSSGTGGS